MMEAEVEGEAAAGVDALDAPVDECGDAAPQPPVAAASTSMSGSSSAAGPSAEAPECKVEVQLRKIGVLLAKGLLNSDEASSLCLECVAKSAHRS